MKRTRSLRNYIFLLMGLLVILQSLALVFSLGFSRVFALLDDEAYRLFDNTTQTRASAFDASVGELVSNIVDEGQALCNGIVAYCEREGTSPQLLHINEGLYRYACITATESMMQMLREYSITGAFVVFAGSNTDWENQNAHSAVYLRNSAPDTPDNLNFQIEAGPAFLAEEYQLAMSANWKLDMHFDSQEKDFYNMPIWASREYPRSELERYGYWSIPAEMFDDRQQVICYTIPLVDDFGNAFGVMGFELSIAHLSRYYLPNTELPYPNSFFIIGQTDGDMIDLEWFVPSGPVAENYLHEGGTLPLTIEENGLGQTYVEGLGSMYCSLYPLRIYNANSPFYEEGWQLISFVGTDVLHETSTDVRQVLVGSIVVTTLVSFVAMLFMSSFATRTLSRLPHVIRSFNPSEEISFQKTGMREIDELTSAIEVLNHSVIHATKTTSKIMELSAIPIGGFEVFSDYVVLTGFLYNFLELSPDETVTLAQWRELYSSLTANPAEDYENVYRAPQRKDRPDRWLRIVQEDVGTGLVGVVMDVTDDVERSRRLAHELDYDALTHLYSRTAFKREVYMRQQEAKDRIGALVFADLDNLKFINDSYGHDVGDRFIIKAGEIFARFSEVGGIVARISGDEFAIYLHGFESRAEALAVVQEQYGRMHNAYMITPDGQAQKIRSSAGIAFFPHDSDNIDNLLKLADFAMYEAKRNSKGTLFEFNRDSYQASMHLSSNREALNRLIDDGLIRFAMQPIVNLKNGEVIGYEALMRPLLDNFTTPMDILSVAADQSKLAQLDRLVLFSALQSVHDNQHLLGDKMVFVNSIPNQLLSDEDMQVLFRQYQHLMSRIVIEITEDQNTTVELLREKAFRIKQVGMKLAIDDFGAGYSNELRLLELDLDIVKVDMGIIQGVHQSVDKQIMVKNIKRLCKQRNIRIIAEGVEEPEDLKMLYQLEVDYVQGNLTGRPEFYPKDVNIQAKDLIRRLNRSQKG